VSLEMNNPNDPTLSSWVESAQGSDFPIQNLPWGIFSDPSNAAPRAGIRIGDSVLDVATLQDAGLLQPELPAGIFRAPALNGFIEFGPAAWSATRARISHLLNSATATLRDNADLRAKALLGASAITLHLPIAVKGFTDFYSSREHAANVGKMFRDPANPLLPNWLYIPVAYNGRASTVVVSGSPVRRPLGQIKPPAAVTPSFEPSRKLDFELEMGVIVGRATAIGEKLSVAGAEEAIFGFALLNDWSARDIQQWEYVPLGPFQGKAFATTLGPWIVTREALEPFRVEGPAQDPPPLPYLAQTGLKNYDIELEVSLTPKGAKVAAIISRTNFAWMYWSSAQQLAHHTACGCAMNVGDLLGSGTISGPGEDSFGSLLELSWNGQKPLALPDGSKRSFIGDGDVVRFSGRASRGGISIGFGVCEGEILPAHPVAGG
jgi:fumarylacetoacetase